MSALSTPLSKQHLTWQKVRTWHPCASSLRPRRLSSDPAASQACLQTSTGFGTGAEPRRPRSTTRSGTAGNNVADRVGKFPSVRLILPSRPGESGRTRQSQSGGNTVLHVEKIITILIQIYCEDEVMHTGLFATFNNCVNKWFWMSYLSVHDGCVTTSPHALLFHSIQNEDYIDIHFLSSSPEGLLHERACNGILLIVKNVELLLRVSSNLSPNKKSKAASLLWLSWQSYMILHMPG